MLWWLVAGSSRGALLVEGAIGVSCHAYLRRTAPCVVEQSRRGAAASVCTGSTALGATPPLGVQEKIGAYQQSASTKHSDFNSSAEAPRNKSVNGEGRLEVLHFARRGRTAPGVVCDIADGFKDYLHGTPSHHCQTPFYPYGSVWRWG